MDIYATKRCKPKLVSPIDSDLSFEEIKENLSKPSFITWVRLLFTSYKTVGTKNHKSGCSDLCGNYLWKYKELNGNFYDLTPYPCPGFPGS